MLGKRNGDGKSIMFSLYGKTECDGGVGSGEERRVGEQRAPAQSAAELVAGSVQLLHPHRATTPSLVPQRDGGGHLEAITGIIYNRTEVMTKKCCSLERQWRRTGERERGLT